MVSKTFSSIAGLALLLLGAVEAGDVTCKLKSNPPAGTNCGVRGYLRNENSYDTYSFDSQYASPEGCAKGCLNRPNCVSWYLGANADYLFCEWHTDTTAAAQFYADPNSYYYGYDQACFDCGPQVSCPDDNGKQVTVGSAIFNIRCYSDYYGGDLARVDADTFGDCLASCASTMGCVDVAYNGHNCYMKSSVTDVRQNGNVWGAILASAEDSAFHRLACPKDDGNTYTAKSGDQFLIQCGVDYFGGDMSSLYAETLADCLEACDKTTGCLDIAMHGKYCYLKNTVTDARQNSDVWGAKKIQAVAPPRRRAELPPTARYSPQKRAELPPTARYNPDGAADAGQSQ